MLLRHIEKFQTKLHQRRELKKELAEQEKLRTQEAIRLLLLPKEQIQVDLENIQQLGYTAEEAREAIRVGQYDYWKAIEHLLMNAIHSLKYEHRPRTLYAIGKLLKADVGCNMDDVLFYFQKSPEERPWMEFERLIQLEIDNGEEIAQLIDEGFHEDQAISAADPHSRDRCHRVEKCGCSTCRANFICSSPDNGRISCLFVHRAANVGKPKADLAKKKLGPNRV